jgi:hypothetical protein
MVACGKKGDYAVGGMQRIPQTDVDTLFLLRRICKDSPPYINTAVATVCVTCSNRNTWAPGYGPGYYSVTGNTWAPGYGPGYYSVTGNMWGL